MIAQVRSYQTSDGKLHQAKVPALHHEASLELRGIIQSNTLGKLTNMTATDVAQFIVQHGEEVLALLRKLKDDTRRATASKS